MVLSQSRVTTNRNMKEIGRPPCFNLAWFSQSVTLSSLVFYYTWFRKPNFCVQTMPEQYLEVCFFFVRGEHAQQPKFEEKKLHKALGSVQFLASFTSFYFETLSYLACFKKIIRLASKNSVKLDEKSASDF